MKNFSFKSLAFGRPQAWWAAVPLLALFFTFSAGRAWPFQIGPQFPMAGRGLDPALNATLYVYVPTARTLYLHTTLLVRAPKEEPLLQLRIVQGAASRAAIFETQSADGSEPAGSASGAAGLIEAAFPLRLFQGTNTLTINLGGIHGAGEGAFSVKSLRLTGSIFNAGNLLFGLTLAAVAAASILAARALGANGLHAFCAAIPVGFLLLTSTATLLSPFHLLDGAAWAAALLAVSLLAGLAALLRLRRHPPSAPAPENTLCPLEAAVLLAVACPCFVMQILSPITRWDDLMYHGPRTGYWLQNASALPFLSHDDRQSVFPIGGDLLFACGTIVSGSELPGKFLVGLALPLILFAMFALLRNAGLRPPAALGAGVVFATTPIVVFNTVGIKPDLWLVLLGVITLHWVLTARRGGAAARAPDAPDAAGTEEDAASAPGAVGLVLAAAMSPAVAGVLAAAAAGLALGVKWTAAPLLLLAPFALLTPGWRQRPARTLLPAGAAFAAALALGGAGPVLLYNLRTSHHPFGPPAMRAWHQPDPGLHPKLVQLARLPFVLFALPYVPTEGLRQTLDHWENAAADALGATEPIWIENTFPGPGRFKPQVKTMDDEFSLGWIFSVLGFGASLYLFGRPADRPTRATVLLITGMSLVFVLAVVTQTRWQVRAGLPDRFLLPGLALGLLAAAWPADRLAARSRWAAAVLCALVALHALLYLRLAVQPFQNGIAGGWQAPLTAESSSEVGAISRQLPPGRTILLFADQGCQEYPLFLARDGFANHVLPWGKAAYDAAAFERAVRQPGVDTVIFLSPDTLNMIWDPALDVRPFIQDMNARGDFGLVPRTGKLVVFARKP